MARTSIAPVALSRDAAVPKGAGTIINATLVTNGVVIPCAGETERLLIEVTNTAASTLAMTIRAGSITPPFSAHQAPRGDLVTSFAKNDVKVFSGLHSARFSQGEDLHIDFATGFTGTIHVYRTPTRA